MRISGGALKGRTVASRRLVRSGSGDLRPTSAKVREALFDILRKDLPDALFLDLYAGTGTVGIEAVSRGAACSYLIESDRRRCATLRQGVERIGLSGKVRIYNDNAMAFLEHADPRTVFDIVFADPPYASDELEQVFPLIGGSHVLRSGGLLVVEHAARKRIVEGHPSLLLLKEYRYGDTMLSLFRKTP